MGLTDRTTRERRLGLKKQISIAAARTDAGLTQAELAKKMGVSRETVNDWENGHREMKTSHFIAFCKITGFDESDILLPTESTKRVQT